MNGVPGGDVTLHAAITETLAQHQLEFREGWQLGSRRHVGCEAHSCGWEYPADGRTLAEEAAAHQAERVLAVLADRLPHTPEALPGLLGRGYVAVEPPYQAAEHGHKATPCRRYVTPKRGGWVPDSPPAVPEPRQDT